MENFNETQIMGKKWWMFLLPSSIIASFPLLLQTQHDLPMQAVFFPLGMLLLVLVLFFLLKLQTKITDKEISIQFFPIMLKPRVIPWTAVKTATLKKYNPLFEYGGWGYKKGWRKRKRAYNVYGNIGLELHLNDDTLVMIGTQNETSLRNYLTYIKGKYNLPSIAI